MFKILKRFFILLIIAVAAVSGINLYVSEKTQMNTYDSTEKIPWNKAGLLLGTSKYTVSGYSNLYYKNRIEAAIELFEAGKIDYIIVSGDNRTMEYNEPVQMQKDLMEKGIPEDRIVLDYAGFRTLDSVVRSREIFSQEKITVISQKFHNERALFIAQSRGIEAVGFNAEDVEGQYGIKTKIREYFARVKMFIDLAMKVEPKFLGEKIDIE